MELSLERPGGFLFVRHVEDDAITIVDHRFTRSLVLARDHVIENWPVQDSTTLEPNDITPILQLQPEVVLLGTGIRQHFPPPCIQATFLMQGIGIEVMTNAAAARTHTVLAGEGRNVVTAFILAGHQR